MNIIETAVTGLAFGAGSIVGVVAGMVVTVTFGKKEREESRKKQDDFNAETVRLLKIRASSSDLIAAAIAEDSKHDKLVRAAVTGLCANPTLVMGISTRNPDGTGKMTIELGEEAIHWAANRIATVVEARERAEQRKLSRELDETLADYQKKQGISHSEWWKEEGKDDLTNTGEAKK